MIELVSRETVGRHPLRVSLLWAVITIPLTALIMAVTGLKTSGPHHFWSTAALIVAVAPVFGYALRRLQIREDARAR